MVTSAPQLTAPQSDLSLRTATNGRPPLMDIKGVDPADILTGITSM